MKGVAGLDLTQYKQLVIVPALATLPARLNGVAAVNLIAGTALVESAGVYLHQLGAGPAIGLEEMEPVTHDDCWVNFLIFMTCSCERLLIILPLLFVTGV